MDADPGDAKAMISGWPFVLAVCSALSLIRVLFVEARRRVRRWRASRRARKAMTPERAAWIASDAFLKSYEWAAVRYAVLEKHGARCVICGLTPHDGIVIVVDHIKSRRSRPDLALEPSNCQPTCRQCNWGKGNKARDWRRKLPWWRASKTP
ncbi:HNH endonuclease [Tundrisphaera sp. TA3]|uniref:HNH endonuclease n=1 Tax=Tundrisphaera sp. TA3 TaxID=3435775 RepID=UPI003EC0A2B6